MPETNYAEWFRFRSGALPETAFHVIRFSGAEGLNTLFSFTIELASLNADIDAEAVLAAEAEFAILRADEPPALFRGYPTRFDQGGHFGGYTFYTVELRPAFWKLTKLVGSAVFLNKKIREAAAEVLHSQQFFHFEHEFHLTRDYPAPEFAMQYGESLYDYVLFRAEEQGIYFYFAPDGDRVIFADSPESHGKPSVTLAYSPASGLDHVRREEVLQSFTLSRSPLPKQVVVRCYDWKDPNRVIVGRAEVSAKGMGDVYLAGEHAESQEQADRLAQIRAEELACRGQVYSGSGSVPVLRPGVVFSLTDHYSASFNRDYMVTEIGHEGSQEAFITLGLGIPLRDAADHFFYRNSFTCIPSDVPYRPARTAPRAKISGVIRAFVDGAQNRRAEMDEYGRYKLIFPFDISGREGGKASCWIRMAGPQTGKDSGMAFPLLPGTEVVVSFIDGDPDRPVITGSLPNGETGSISHRGNPDISGIRTAGGNQLTINDTDKKQGISLTTAGGLGYHMLSGSLGANAEIADVALRASSVGFAEATGAFKSVAAGFSVKHTASNCWWNFAAPLITQGSNAIVGAMDTLSAADKAKDKTRTDAASAADAFKLLAAVMQTADGGVKTALAAKDTSAPYGVMLTAKKELSKSAVQVRPDGKQLIASLALWVASRVTAAGTAFRDAAQEEVHDGPEFKHEAIRSSVINPLAELLPEIAAFLVTCVSAHKLREAKAGGMGGVALASEDNNVNIRAAKTVSMHSETGILLETKLKLNDAGKWGVTPNENTKQALGDRWRLTQDNPSDAGNYIVADTGTLGLFADNVRAKAATDWVSVSPTHTLKSSGADAPNAQLKIADSDCDNNDAEGGIVAKVKAHGTISLQRGDADGQTLSLTDDCVLQNGKDVVLTLGKSAVSIEAEDSELRMGKKLVGILGDDSSITCESGKITLDAPKVVVSGVTFEESKLKGRGTLELQDGAIKIIT